MYGISTRIFLKRVPVDYLLQDAIANKTERLCAGSIQQITNVTPHYSLQPSNPLSLAVYLQIYIPPPLLGQRHFQSHIQSPTHQARINLLSTLYRALFLVISRMPCEPRTTALHFPPTSKSDIHASVNWIARSSDVSPLSSRVPPTLVQLL